MKMEDYEKVAYFKGILKGLNVSLKVLKIFVAGNKEAEDIVNKTLELIEKETEEC
jgi:hypothetical protein